MRRVAAMAAVFLLLLSGCMTGKQRPASDSEGQLAGSARTLGLQTISNWSFRGRIALSDGQDGGSGTLSWVQRGDTSSLSFYGALGKGAWQLQSEPGRAVLEVAGEEPVFSEDVEALAEEILGWPVPIHALAYWVRGIHQPGSPVTGTQDEKGRLESLEQHGWRVVYNRWSDRYEPIMPSKLEASSGAYQVKLIVRAWKLNH